MEWCTEWEPGLPMVSTSTITQEDQQQFLLSFVEVLWGGAAALFDYFSQTLDMNTAWRNLLQDRYGIINNDLVPLLARYFSEPAVVAKDTTLGYQNLIAIAHGQKSPTDNP